MTSQLRPVVAYLTAYEISRHYGGPEEGGWWYDAHEHLCSFPFHTHLRMEEQMVEDDEECRRINEGETTGWYDHEQEAFFRFVPNGLIQPSDEPTRVLLESVRYQYEAMYGSEDTNYRFSMAPRGPDYVFVMELEQGELARRGRPRYE